MHWSKSVRICASSVATGSTLEVIVPPVGFVFIDEMALNTKMSRLRVIYLLAVNVAERRLPISTGRPRPLLVRSGSR